ncbi:hypothetical protein LAUMK13_04674 [Mycobacterium innocens]|uniref:Transposase DDE domain-containing protein n=1 Tax=Mycobacterium innocens TaxID=2341083 RepID=A0A498QG53_9MYCO|nr:hypothetical protein LAUMK13_04674 [Mycobacterium innocens]
MFLDRPDIAAGEALAGLLRKGNAGSNTTDDHISVLDQALASLPAQYRPDPDNPDAPKVLIRSDSAGATYGFAAACRISGVGFSLGAVIDAPIRDAVEVLNTADGWYPAIDSGGIRDGAWVAEATALVDLSKWPTGTRLILRLEGRHPGAQLRFTDSDGHRVTGFFTDTPDGVVPGQLAGLELRHRQHARVEDRIRQAKATGLPNLPFNAFEANAAWLEIVMAATDLIAWAKLIGFTDHPELACCEIATFRYRVLLHVAARITCSARQTRLRIDTSWRWAHAIAAAWTQIRAAFASPNLPPRDPTRRKTRRPEESPPPERHRANRHTHMPQSTSPARRQPASPPSQPARKIEASANSVQETRMSRWPPSSASRRWACPSGSRAASLMGVVALMSKGASALADAARARRAASKNCPIRG